MKRNTMIAVVLVVGGAIGLTVWVILKSRNDQPSPADANRPTAPGVPTTKPNGQVAVVNEILSTTRPENHLTPAEAKEAYKEGKELLAAKKLVEARTRLSRALASGHLSGAEEDDAIAMLSDLAEKIIFSKEIIDGDPYAFPYVVKPRETLAGVNGIERTQKLHVPEDLLLRVNGLRRAVDLRDGQTLKLVRGPFHAIVTKGKFTMDVYVGDAFVRRYRIGIGARETPTPEGFFHVTPGGKLSNAPYSPPSNSGLATRRILPGAPGYPLDSGGHWISLTGIPEKGTDIRKDDGYGIHGTNDPGSIGKSQSHGCVRLVEKDIVELFSLLYDKWSTVEIRP
jgi:hypothetical protein